MFARFAVLLLVGCTAPQIAIRSAEPSVIDEHDETTALAMCTPAAKVTVTDSAGAPVAGALVVVRQREHALCPSMGPTTPLYTTAPVRTDSHGIATTCDPDSFLRDDSSSLCRHHRDPATIVVIAGDQAAQLAPPFTAELHAVLGPCADLRARDPEFPCAATKN